MSYFQMDDVTVAPFEEHRERERERKNEKKKRKYVDSTWQHAMLQR